MYNSHYIPPFNVALEIKKTVHSFLFCMWKNAFYLQNKWGRITSAHGLFQMAFNFARECVFLIGVSEGEFV